MASAIDKELLTQINLLNTTQKKSLLSVIKSFLNPAAEEKRISKSQYNKEIKAAEKRIDSGHYLTQDEVEKESGKW